MLQAYAQQLASLFTSLLQNLKEEAMMSCLSVMETMITMFPAEASQILFAPLSSNLPGFLKKTVCYLL